MKLPIFQPSGPGPRRPGPPKTALHSYQRTPVRTLRTFPIRSNPRLTLLDYRRTEAPGLVNTRLSKPRTHGHGAARIADSYVLSVCLTRDDDDWYLETETYCYDEQAGRSAVIWADTLLADVYRAIQSKETASEGRAYGRGHGRN